MDMLLGNAQRPRTLFALAFRTMADALPPLAAFRALSSRAQPARGVLEAYREAGRLVTSENANVAALLENVRAGAIVSGLFQPHAFPLEGRDQLLGYDDWAANRDRFPAELPIDALYCGLVQTATDEYGLVLQKVSCSVSSKAGRTFAALLSFPAAVSNTRRRAMQGFCAHETDAIIDLEGEPARIAALAHNDCVLAFLAAGGDSDRAAGRAAVDALLQRFEACLAAERVGSVQLLTPAELAWFRGRVEPVNSLITADPEAGELNYGGYLAILGELVEDEVAEEMEEEEETLTDNSDEE